MKVRPIAWQTSPLFVLLLATYLAPVPATAGGSDFHHQLSMSSREDSARAKTPRKKSPNGAMLRSLLFPGWGQLYNHQPIKAVLVLAAQGTLVGMAVHYNNRAKRSLTDSDAHEFYVDKRNQTFWFMGGVTLLSMLDAYIDAYLFDFDAGPDLALQAGVLSNQTSPPALGISLRASF
ncbi:MAG TPA: DUF5683 domain-containing protein [bacterium]